MEERRVQMKQESERLITQATISFQTFKDATETLISGLLTTIMEMQTDSNIIETAQSTRMDNLEKLLNDQFNTLMLSIGNLQQDQQSKVKPPSDAESERRLQTHSCVNTPHSNIG